MKTRHVLTCALALGLMPVFAEDAPPEAAEKLPSAEEVLDKALEAGGGKAAFEKVKSLEEVATATLPKQNITMHATTLCKGPHCCYTTSEVPGMFKQEQAFDGKTGWAKDPMNGLRDLSPEEVTQIRQGTLASWDWKDTFEKAELARKDKVGDAEAYVVVLTPKVGHPVTRWYDAKSFLLLREDGTEVSPNGEAKKSSRYLDYQVVEGLRLPSEIRTVSSGVEAVIKITSRRFNLEIPDSRFAKPKEEAGEDGAGEKGEAP